MRVGVSKDQSVDHLVIKAFVYAKDHFTQKLKLSSEMAYD